MDEPVLVDADFVYAAQRGGSITKSILAVIMESDEWKEIESSEAFINGELSPKVNTSAKWVNRAETICDRWENARLRGTYPFYGFNCIVSHVPWGLVDTVYVSDQIVLDTDKPTLQALQKLMADRRANNPPQLAVHGCGEILYLDSETIYRPAMPHDFGWLFFFNLSYSDKQPIHQCDVLDNSTD